MKKVAVIGCGGAGKSTFSRKIAEILNIPVYHLDKLYWRPGWVPTPNDEWDYLIKNLVSKEKWIIDGNYGRTLDTRLENADTVIFFNINRYLCIYRIIKRRLMYNGITRPDMNEGCPEKLDLDFIKWVWGFNKNKKPEILSKLNKFSTQKNIIIFNNSCEADSFINDIKNNNFIIH